MSKSVWLCGFMGSGKTTTLLNLKQLGAQEFEQFIDLDRWLIEQRGVKSIADWVERFGWSDFRSWEKKALEELASRDRVALALGGGSFAHGRHLLAQNPHVTAIYLEVPFAECWRRIQISDRPLVQLGESALADLYQQRICEYQHAHHRFSFPLSSEEIAVGILKL